MFVSARHCRYCLPRPPTRYKPSFRDLNGILDAASNICQTLSSGPNMVGELSSDDILVVDESLVAASLGEALVGVEPSSLGESLVGAEPTLGEDVAVAEPPLGELTLGETLVAKGRTIIYYIGGFISLQVVGRLIRS